MDFLLRMFPLGTSQEADATEDADGKEFGPILQANAAESTATMSKEHDQNDDPILQANATENVATLPEEHDQNESSDNNEATGEGLRFDPNLGATYGFTELNVSFQLKIRFTVFPIII